ncbi:MAG: trypsin-like serine protease [Gemmataceae bacterium]
MPLARLAGLLLTLAASAPAGEIVGYVPGDPASKATYDRFASGFPSAPVANTDPAFTGSGLDLSGVGWRVADPRFGLTLISPQHFVTAAHVGGFSAGQQVRFTAGDGTALTVTLANDGATGAVRQFRPTTTFVNGQGQTQTLPSDVLVVKLPAPIDPATGIRPLAVGSGTLLAGTPLLVYGQNPAYSPGPQLGRNTLDTIEVASFDGPTPTTEATVVAGDDYTRTPPGDTALIGGDSGSPLLVRQGNTAVTVGTHYGIEGDLAKPDLPYTSYSALLPAYLDQIQAFVAADGQALTVVPVPEPATVGLAAVAGLLGVRWVRRRAR